MFKTARLQKFRSRLQESGLFDPLWYLDHHSDVAAANYDALQHYLNHGQAENRSPGPSFDAAWYAGAHWASMKRRESAIEHYLRIGKSRALQTLPDPVILPPQEDLDVAATGEASDAAEPGSEPDLPLDPPPPEAEVEGEAEPEVPGDAEDAVVCDSETDLPLDPPLSEEDQRIQTLSESGLFDREAYCRLYPQITRVYIEPIRHFVIHGSTEHLSPSDDFNAAWYFEEYMLEDAAETEPVFHYIKIGRDKGYRTKPHQSYEDWTRRYRTPDDQDLARLASSLNDSERPHAVLSVVVLNARPTGPGDEDDGTPPAPAPIAMARWQAGIPQDFHSDIDDATASQHPIYTHADLIDLINQQDDRTLILLANEDVAFRGHALMVASCYVRPSPFVLYSDFETIAEDSATPYFFPAFAPRIFERIGPKIEAIFFNKAAFEKADPADGSFDLTPNRLFAQLCKSAGTAILHCSEILHAVPARNVPSARAPGIPFALEDPLPTVSIIIPTKDHHDVLKSCIDAIVNMTDYPRDRFDIVIVDNDTSDADASAYLDSLSRQGGFAIIRYRKPFNYSAMNNVAVRTSTADVIVLLNNDTVVIDPDWLTRLVTELQAPDVGAVGIKLLFPDSNVQHGGVILGINGIAGHSHVSFAANARGFQDLNVLTREVSVVTGACLAVKRATYNAVGGLDVELPVAFNDVAFCVELRRRGYRNLWIDKAALYHLESKTRGRDLSSDKMESLVRAALVFIRGYRQVGRDDDCYSSNLSLSAPYELAEPPRRMAFWRAWPHDGERRRVLMLIYSYRQGQGAATIAAIQARWLLDQGYDVYLGGPRSSHDVDVAGARRITLSTAAEAARFAGRHKIDLMIAYSAPFYSVSRFMGAYPAVLLYDLGAPPANAPRAPDTRRDFDGEKALSFALARFHVAVSAGVSAASTVEAMPVLVPGNTHLSTWSSSREDERNAARLHHGWSDAFVVLTLCGLDTDERVLNEIDDYIDLALRAQAMNPDRRVLFVACGPMKEDADSAWPDGVEVVANASDADVTDLYLAADLYMSLSRWDGYDIGLAQALAFGLPALACRTAGHEVETVATFEHHAQLLQRLNAILQEGAKRCDPIIHDWASSLEAFSRLIETCLRESMQTCLEIL